jgi:DNA-binding transcriptional ArsR family regulator
MTEATATPHDKYLATLEEFQALEKILSEEIDSATAYSQAREDALAAAASESKISKASLTKAIEADMAARVSAMRQSNTSEKVSKLEAAIFPIFEESCRSVRFRLDTWWHEWREKELVRILGKEKGTAAFARTIPNDGADRLIEESDMAKLYRRHGSDGVNAPQSEPAYRTAYKDALAFVEEQEAALKKA